MKKKIILSIAFIFSLLPMLLNQYGGAKGVQEISGLVNLFNPVGIVSVLLFIVGIWLPFKNITGEISIQNSINFAFPEFYIGLVISLIMVIAYFVIDKIVKE